MKRVCIFIDGENFRHSIVDLFECFSNSDYLPSNADWNSFFNLLVSRITEPAELVRAYWYCIALPCSFPFVESYTKLKFRKCPIPTEAIHHAI